MPRAPRTASMLAAAALAVVLGAGCGEAADGGAGADTGGDTEAPEAGGDTGGEGEGGDSGLY